MKNQHLKQIFLTTICNPIFSYQHLKFRLHKALVTFKVAVLRESCSDFVFNKIVP